MIEVFRHNPIYLQIDSELVADLLLQDTARTWAWLRCHLLDTTYTLSMRIASVLSHSRKQYKFLVPDFIGSALLNCLL